MGLTWIRRGRRRRPGLPHGSVVTPAKFTALHFRLFSGIACNVLVSEGREEGSCAVCVLVRRSSSSSSYLNESLEACRPRREKEGGCARRGKPRARPPAGGSAVVKYSGEGRRGDERSRTPLLLLLFTFGLLDRFTLWRQLRLNFAASCRPLECLKSGASSAVNFSEYE